MKNRRKIKINSESAKTSRKTQVENKITKCSVGFVIGLKKWVYKFSYVIGKSSWF